MSVMFIVIVVELFCFVFFFLFVYMYSYIIIYQLLLEAYSADTCGIANWYYVYSTSIYM